MARKVVIHIVYSLTGAGAVESRARDEIKAALAMGHEVVAVTDRLRDDSVPGARTWASTGPGLWRALPGPGSELAAMAVSWRGLERALSKVRPDVIVFHNSTLAWPVLRAARRTQARSVFVVQALIRDRLEAGGNPYGPATTALYRIANRRALRGSDIVICISSHMARTAEAEGAPRERVRIVPNPVDTGFFQQSAGARDIDVLYVGRLSYEKGVDVLLRALRPLGSESRVVIGGDGPLRARLEAQAAGMSARVEFVGWLNREELREMYGRAAVIAVPSRSEPQGVVVLEALASGTPVVGSAVGGIAETLVDGENGWLVPPDDSEQLGRAIATALSDRERLQRMSASTRESIARFSLEQFPALIQDAYLGG